MALSFIRKLIGSRPAKPSAPVVPKTAPAYVLPKLPAKDPYVEVITAPSGYGVPAKLGPGRSPIGGYIPGTFIPHYTPPRIEGLEDVVLAPQHGGAKSRGILGRGGAPVAGFKKGPAYANAWDPKYPAFADDNTDLEDLHDEDGSWIPAPGGSHLESLRYFPAKIRKKNFASRIVQDSGNSYIDIRFKPSEYNGTTEYRYTFPPSQEWLAEDIWQLLIAAAHPGVIVHEYLIDLKIQYKRIS